MDTELPYFATKTDVLPTPGVKPLRKERSDKGTKRGPNKRTLKDTSKETTVIKDR